MQFTEPGLSGLKKIRKRLKKLVKPLAHIGAAYFTGGASLKLSADMMKSRADRKNAVSMQQAEHAAAARMTAPTASPYERVTQLAPTAESVARMLPHPTFTRQYANGDGRAYRGTAPQPSLPAWAVPTAIAGGAALLLLTMMRGKT